MRGLNAMVVALAAAFAGSGTDRTCYEITRPPQIELSHFRFQRGGGGNGPARSGKRSWKQRGKKRRARGR